MSKDSVDKKTDARRRKKKYPRYRDTGDLVPEKHAALAVEMALNGGSPQKAAKALGIPVGTAQQLSAHSPHVRKLVALASEAPKSMLREWLDLAIKAQNTLEQLLDCNDHRVRFLAAREVLDRALGKAVEKRESTSTRTIKFAIDHDTMQSALMLSAARGWSLAASLEYTRLHPEEVRAWIQGPQDIPATVVQE